jgi:hypothetical protein
MCDIVCRARLGGGDKCATPLRRYLGDVLCQLCPMSCSSLVSGCPYLTYHLAVAVVAAPLLSTVLLCALCAVAVASSPVASGSGCIIATLHASAIGDWCCCMNAHTVALSAVARTSAEAGRVL